MTHDQLLFTQIRPLSCMDSEEEYWIDFSMDCSLSKNVTKRCPDCSNPCELFTIKLIALVLVYINLDDFWSGVANFSLPTSTCPCMVHDLRVRAPHHTTSIEWLTFCDLLMSHAEWSTPMRDGCSQAASSVKFYRLADQYPPPCLDKHRVLLDNSPGPRWSWLCHHW